jgi:phospholipase C
VKCKLKKLLSVIKRGLTRTFQFFEYERFPFRIEVKVLCLFEFTKRMLPRLLLVVLLVFSFGFPQQATPIDHVIIIIEENHSFDNLFGTYPFGWPPIITNTTLSVMWPDGLYQNYTQLKSSKNGELYWISIPNVPADPTHGYSHPYYANASSTQDPVEGWSVYHADYSSQGFVYYSGIQSLAYFSYQQLAPLWDYAEEYVLADNYFAPVLGLTEPNRVAYLTGFPPSFQDNYETNVIPFNKTIMYQLSQNNISWGYYVYGYQGGVPWPLTAFQGAQNYEKNFHSLADFYKELNGSLPQVSWVMFLGGSTNEYDLHPPYNVTQGVITLVNVINAVMKSKYANSCVIFVTFDEGGGYFDHVSPPTLDGYTLGQRIPLLVISPYAKEGWVDNYSLSAYSLISFIEYNWHLPPLTPWVKNSDLKGLLAAFEFSEPPRNPIVIHNWNYPIPLQYPVHYGFIARVQTQVNTKKGAPNYLLLALLIVLALLLFRKRKT